MGSNNGPASHKPGSGHEEEEHEEHVNHEAWVIPYADMLTLLMALFLMLWATSNVDSQRFAALAESLRDAFGGGTGTLTQAATIGTPGILDGRQSSVEGGDAEDSQQIKQLNPLVKEALTQKADSAESRQMTPEQKKRIEDEIREAATLNGIEKRIAAEAEEKGLLGSLKFSREARGLVVTIVTDNVLFESGSAQLRPGGSEILSVVGSALVGVPNDIVVEGHTDSVPISTSQFPTNWELSGARGMSVVRFLIEQTGLPANRVGGAGYGDTRPVSDNRTADGRSANRRVEVVVLSNVK